MAERLRSRFRRADVLKRVLKPYGLNMHDGGSVPGIQISNQFGSEIIVRDLAEVLALAEQWTGSAVDPLDPRFTAHAEKAL